MNIYIYVYLHTFLLCTALVWIWLSREDRLSPWNLQESRGNLEGS